MSYVEQLSTAPSTPTQLIQFSKKKEMTGITWTKCSKYFKVLHGESSRPVRKHSEPIPRKHHKTASGPLFLQNNALSNPANLLTATSTAHGHKRAHSALDSQTLTSKNKINIPSISTKKAPFETLQTVMLDTLLTDIKEDFTHDDDAQLPIQKHSNGAETSTKPSAAKPTAVLSPRIVITPVHSTKPETILLPKEVSKTKTARKQALRNKPWNKHKSATWPKNRMPMSFELKKWLTDNKFDRFIAKLYHYGLETMKDLRLLSTEDIIEDLSGANHVKMTIIYRRKFIKKVLELNRKRRKKESEEHVELFPMNEQKQYESETQAVQALTVNIKQATKSMRMNKQIQSDIEENVKTVRNKIVADFDELIKAIALRKKQLLQTLDAQHQMSVNKVEDQYTNICQTAKTLLITQQGISQYVKGSEPSAARKEDVIDLVESCFTECEKYTPKDHTYVVKADFKYNEGSNAQINSYGKLMFDGEQLV
eukprot:205337_1